MAVYFSNNRNPLFARRFYLIASKADCESQFITATYYQDENDIENAIVYFERCFSHVINFYSLTQVEKLCVSKSINNLMLIYEDKKDFVKLIEMLRKASFYGHKSSTEFLGLFYYDLENYYEAKHYFQLCVNQMAGKIKVYYCNLLRNCLVQLNQLKRT